MLLNITPHRYSGRRHDLVTSSVTKVSCLLKPKQWLYKADLQHAYHYKKKIWKGVSEGILWRGVFHACLHRHWLLHSLIPYPINSQIWEIFHQRKLGPFAHPNIEFEKLKALSRFLGLPLHAPQQKGAGWRRSKDLFPTIKGKSHRMKELSWNSLLAAIKWNQNNAFTLK